MRHEAIEDALLEGTKAAVQGLDTCDGCGNVIDDDGTHLCFRCR